MKIQMRNPQTGGTGLVEIDRLQEAVRDGMEVAQDLDLFNPETGGTGKLAGAQAAQAIADGLLPVGSHAHKVATTGKLESAARGALQGATFGFADEIAGAVESAITDKTYQQARDESRANFAAASEANPISSTLGELGGGAASFLVPGVGALGKVTGGIGSEIAAGAKLGALYGAGKSQADLTKGQVGDFATDVVKDAAGGGVAAGVLGILGRGLGFASQKGQEAISHAFDPAEQRALAVGAKAKDLVRNEDTAQWMNTLKEYHVFDIDEHGRLPGRELIAERIEKLRQKAADGLIELFEQQGGGRADLRKLEPALDTLWENIRSARPNQQQGAWSELVDLPNSWLDRIQASGGKMSELWKIKKDLGKSVNWDVESKTFNANTENMMALNKALGDLLKQETNGVAGELGSTTLGQLNEIYAATANTQEMLAKQLAQDMAASSFMGQKFGDLAGGGLGATAGAAIGGPVGAGVGYAATTIGASALRSPQGRLWRAQIGEAAKAQTERAALAAGAVPRTVEGVKQWLSQNIPLVDQMAPQLSEMARRVVKEPPAAAEMTIRTAMPFLTTLMTPSPYPSELDGKVSEPADKLVVRKQIEQLPGLTPSARAVRLSALNKDGTVPSELYAPQQPGDPLQDEVDAFARRLQAMGY